MDGESYFKVLLAIHNHSPIMVDAVLLQNNSEHTF